MTLLVIAGWALDMMASMTAGMVELSSACLTGSKALPRKYLLGLLRNDFAGTARVLLLLLLVATNDDRVTFDTVLCGTSGVMTTTKTIDATA